MNSTAKKTIALNCSSKSENNNFQLGVIRRFYIFVVIISCLVQGIFFLGQPDNLLTSLIALVASLAAIQYSLHIERVASNPISTLMILSFNFVSISGALIFKTLSFSALVEYLVNPAATFTALATVQIALILAHILYRKLSIARMIKNWLSSRIFHRLKVFDQPTNAQLWMMGAIGFMAVMANAKTYTNGLDANIGLKLLPGLNFLMLAPFLIPFMPYLNKNIRDRKQHLIPIIIYFMCLIVLGFMTNTRSIFFNAIATPGAILFLLVVTGKIQVRSSILIKATVVFLVAIPLVYILTDIATAMVMVRGVRADVTGNELICLTWEALLDKDALNTFKAASNVILTGDYNEVYLNNPLLERLIVTKYLDNMFYYSHDFSNSDITELWKFFGEKIIAIFPQPIIDLLGFDFDKKIVGTSTGTYIYYLATGNGYGEYMLGSMVAQGFVLMGFLFPLALMGLAIVIFTVYDAFAAQKSTGILIISPLILIQSWSLFGATAGATFGAESISNMIDGLIRGVPQMVLIYFVVFKISRIGRLGFG